MEHLKRTFFKTYGQLIGTDKNREDLVLLMCVIPVKDVSSKLLPNQFEINGMILEPNIWQGTYPQLKLFNDNIIERDDLRGMGLEAIATEGGVFSFKVDSVFDYNGIKFPK